MLATPTIDASCDGGGGIVDSLFTPPISLIHLGVSLIIEQPPDMPPYTPTSRLPVEFASTPLNGQHPHSITPRNRSQIAFLDNLPKGYPTGKG